jgi:hypothetical protein
MWKEDNGLLREGRDFRRDTMRSDVEPGAEDGFPGAVATSEVMPMLPVRNVGCARRRYVDVVIAPQEEQVSLWAELVEAWRDVSTRRKPIVISTAALPGSFG